MRFVFLTTMILAVAGCGGVSDNPTPKPEKSAKSAGVFGFLARPEPMAPAGVDVLVKSPVFGGDVVIAGPKGYCIDANSFTDKITGAFALLASCQNLTDGKTGDLVDTAVMSVTVLPRRLRAGQPDSAALEIDGVKVLDQINGDGFSLVHLAAGGNTLSPSLDAKYWRGGMLINGHIVGISIYAPKGSKLAQRPGRFVAFSLAEMLRTASPVKTYQPVQTSAVIPTEAVEATPPRANPLRRLFPRVFQ